MKFLVNDAIKGINKSKARELFKKDHNGFQSINFDIDKIIKEKIETIGIDNINTGNITEIIKDLNNGFDKASNNYAEFVSMLDSQYTHTLTSLCEYLDYQNKYLEDLSERKISKKRDIKNILRDKHDFRLQEKSLTEIEKFMEEKLKVQPTQGGNKEKLQHIVAPSRTNQ